MGPFFIFVLVKCEELTGANQELMQRFARLGKIGFFAG